MYNNIEVRQIDKNSEEEWNQLMLNSPNASYRQSMAVEYARTYKKRNTQTHIFYNTNDVIAGVHYSKKDLLGNYISTGDILSGYLFLSIPNEEIWHFLLKHFIEWGKENNTSMLTFTPWIPRIINGVKIPYSNSIDKILKLHGFNSALPGRHTYWLDLTQSEEEKLFNMKRQTRYDIRNGIRAGLQVERVSNPDEKLFETFWDFYHNLGTQKKFDILNKNYLKLQLYSLMNAGMASMFIVRFKNNIVNISFASTIGQASYLYGAMNPRFKEINGCPSPGPLAQWAMIQYSKSLGLKIYDLGFCPGPIPQRDHPQYSIWRFKYGFGGDHVEFLPTYAKKLYPVRGNILHYMKFRR